MSAIYSKLSSRFDLNMPKQTNKRKQNVAERSVRAEETSKITSLRYSAKRAA